MKKPRWAGLDSTLGFGPGLMRRFKEGAEMDQKFQNDLIAELLALNQIVHQTLSLLVQASGEPREFLKAELERGLENIDRTRLWSVPEEQQEAVRENAKARFSDIVTSVRV